MTGSFRWLFLFFLFLSLSFGQAVNADTAPLRVGVAPDGTGSVALAKRWIPFLNQLEARSELTFQFVTAPDLLAFHQRLKSQVYDVVVTDSYLYTIFKQKHALQFLAQLGFSDVEDDLVLVCHPEITHIEQVNGALLAVRQDEANSNLQLLDEYLTSNSVTVLRDGLSSDEKVLSSIIEKSHVAGLLPLNIAKNNQQSLNILWQAQNQQQFLVSMSPSLGDDMRAQLRHALKQMSDTDEPEISVISVHQRPVE